MDETKITELYSEAEMARMRRRILCWQRFLTGLAAAALAACIGMILLTNTLNAQRMELTTVAVSTAAGWVELYCISFILVPARREMAHAAMLHTEERSSVAGEVILTEERVQIRNSITARRVEVRGESGTSRLLVCDSRATRLSSLGAAVLYTCHSYVAAYEAAP